MVAGGKTSVSPSARTLHDDPDEPHHLPSGELEQERAQRGGLPTGDGREELSSCRRSISAAVGGCSGSPRLPLAIRGCRQPVEGEVHLRGATEQVVVATTWISL